MKRPKLGIMAPETFSVCRMVNVDEDSPKLHSSLSVIQNDQNLHALHVGIHVEEGKIVYLVQNSCDIGTPRFLDIVEFYGGMVEGLREKMVLLCRENIDRAGVLNLMTEEVLEFALGRPSEVRRGVTKLMKRCFGE